MLLSHSTDSGTSYKQICQAAVRCFRVVIIAGTSAFENFSGLSICSNIWEKVQENLKLMKNITYLKIVGVVNILWKKIT